MFQPKFGDLASFANWHRFIDGQPEKRSSYSGVDPVNARYIGLVSLAGKTYHMGMNAEDVLILAPYVYKPFLRSYPGDGLASEVAKWLHEHGVAFVRWCIYYDDDEGYFDWVRLYDEKKNEVEIGGFFPEDDMDNTMWQSGCGIWEMTCPSGAVRQVGDAFMPERYVSHQYFPGETDLE